MVSPLIGLNNPDGLLRVKEADSVGVSTVMALTVRGCGGLAMPGVAVADTPKGFPPTAATIRSGNVGEEAWVRGGKRLHDEPLPNTEPHGSTGIRPPIRRATTPGAHHR